MAEFMGSDVFDVCAVRDVAAGRIRSEVETAIPEDDVAVDQPATRPPGVGRRYGATAGRVSKQDDVATVVGRGRVIDASPVDIAEQRSRLSTPDIHGRA